MLKRLLIGSIRLYQRFFSKLLPPTCKYVPSCSQYAVESVEKYGIIRGPIKAIWRVLRCNPFSRGGYDPVK